MGKKSRLKEDITASSSGAMNSETHVVQFKSRKRYKCKDCSYACVRPSEMRMHALVHSHEKPYCCNGCEARFTQASSLKRHYERTHIKVKEFKCCECNYAGSTKDNLVSHKKVHSVDKPFSCKECKRAFASAGQLKKHQSVTHVKEKRLKCPSCEFSCLWPSSLKTHLLVHTGEKTFKCAMCGKWFFRLSHLQRHNLTQHLTLKPIKCPHCKYSCAVKESLKQHLLRHSAQKKHECSKCGSAFTTPALLRRHDTIVHIKEKRYKCSLCSYGSYFKSDLEKHKQCHGVQSPVHVGDEVFNCVVCQSTFDSKLRLELHATQHTESAPFSCSICGSTFRADKGLKKHMANLH